ncbi:MAG: YaaR family protein [Thermoanaerobacteraceae bacterium]|nr:YaaR family protein [Thermoanaerobacteraceae bacterium]
MKVENVRLNRVSTPVTVKNKNSGSSFKDSLLNAEEDYNHERLKKLMEDIDEKSKELKEMLDLNSLMAYKEMVSTFLREALSAFTASKRDYLDYSGRHKIYVIIEEVNEKLSKLTEDFMKKEKDTLDVLEKIDEIRGLLVDIYN